jgi:hypothetical protein
MRKPTPPFFKKLRNIGLVVAGIAGAIATAPIALPAAVTSIAGYLTVAGSIASAVSQLTTREESQPQPSNTIEDVE